MANDYTAAAGGPARRDPSKDKWRALIADFGRWDEYAAIV